MPPTTDEAAEQVTGPTPAPEAPDTDPAAPEPQVQQAEPEQTEPEASGEKQPADVGENTAVQIHAGSYGMLTLDPKQKRLNDDQRGALLAIGIDTNKDPGIRDHVAPFIHVCQLRGLDPWAREAYLIGRGWGDNRKYTMQVGIDGYLKMASATGRFIRIAEVLWTGTDDDDRSWRETENAAGRIVRKRVWSDAWPEARGHPGQALVVIEHYDTFGNVTTTEAIADWSMYAPYNEKKTGRWPNKTTVTDDDGKPVMELSDMWARGGAHMLAKCATALACRRAFPGATAGVYMTEEMHAADAAENARQEQHARNDRARRVQALRPANQQDEPPAVDPATGETEPDREPGPVDPVEAMRSAPSGPLPGVVEGEVVSDTTEDTPPEPTEGQEREWLEAELDLMGRVLHNPPAGLMRRSVAARRKNLEDFTDAELLSSIAPMRDMVAQQLRTAVPEAAGMADAWAQVTDDQCGPTWWLLGLHEGDEPFPGDAPVG